MCGVDGGGVRGYSMLLLLQEVMHKVFVETEGRAPEKWEIPRPCDHFDLIGGTGTGGLIALLLGRLRVDVATALELWVDMARRVFETDKTLVGIPYGKTLYKASKLEEAIKEVVSIYETSETADRRKKLPHSPASSVSAGGKIKLRRSHTMPSVASLTLDASPIPPSVEHIWKPQLYDLLTGRGALWYDERPGRCKTFVTAVYKGSAPGSPPALLRTYDSPAETCLSGNCTIWEAGRASCAIFPAFKPIQVGQNIFLDEGHGKFNPAPLVLEEAIAHEWPGREIGVFISIGSGKLPPHMENPPLGTTKTTSVRGSIIGVTPLQKFVDARENYMLKIEECEQLHLETVRKLRAKGIDEEAYFRLNVDTGVGQAGMAEWYRLADISTGTRAYLSKPNVQRMNANAAKRLAKIWKDKHADVSFHLPSIDCSAQNVDDI
ncbi:acyl transferase/acyl hydrolase/lysophospholipase [Kalaharituber pfeilii]|nr:acyl transferase/acyl hydrolase/lysophospholipase [Kalaharituber pfeilii]